MAWIGDIYQKFEALCSEMDEAMQQSLSHPFGQYVENQLQTVGDNVKQFCSDLVRDVLPQHSKDTGEDAAPDSSLEKDPEQETDYVGDSVSSCSAEPVKVTQSDSSLVEASDDELSKKSEAPIEEKYPEEKQLELDISEEFPSEENSASSMMGVSLASNDLLAGDSCEKVVHASFSSSTSAHVTTPAIESSAQEFEMQQDNNESKLISPSDETGKSADCTDDTSCQGLSKKAMLHGSCITIDVSELPSVHHDAGRRNRSYKKKIVEAFTSKRRGTKQQQDYDRLAAWCRNSDFGFSLERGEEYASHSPAAPNHELCESDWEIISYNDVSN